MANLAVGAVTGVRRRHGALLFPARVGAGLLVTYALAEGNFGTAYRHRGEIVWIVVVFATVGLHDLGRRQEAPARHDHASESGRPG